MKNSDSETGFMEKNDRILSIYRLSDINEVEGLEASLDQLKQYTQVHVSQRYVPAVAGELAGTITDILLSSQVQAVTTAAELGALLWGTIKCIKAAGKYLRLKKGIVRPLLAAKVQEEIGPEDVGLASGVVWGPMDAEILFGPGRGFDRDGQTPAAYFMAIAVPRPKHRVRTIYYLLGSDGEICASWSTQTLRDRVPEFLRPIEQSQGKRPKSRFRPKIRGWCRYLY